MRLGTDRDVEITSGCGMSGPRGDPEARAHRDEQATRRRAPRRGMRAEMKSRAACFPRRKIPAMGWIHPILCLCGWARAGANARKTRCAGKRLAQAKIAGGPRQNWRRGSGASVWRGCATSIQRTISTRSGQRTNATISRAWATHWQIVQCFGSCGVLGASEDDLSDDDSCE